MKLKIEKGSKYEEMTKAVIDNNNYCPCMIEQSDDTKCMCKEFKEQDFEGECHCRRFKKMKPND
jgi:hypothetical protein